MRIQTMTVVEGEPFELPEGAVIVTFKQVYWSMDGKTRWRIVYTLPK